MGDITSHVTHEMQVSEDSEVLKVKQKVSKTFKVIKITKHSQLQTLRNLSKDRENVAESACII